MSGAKELGSDEIQQLPRWAAVALAGRVVLRVAPVHAAFGHKELAGQADAATREAGDAVVLSAAHAKPVPRLKKIAEMAVTASNRLSARWRDKQANALTGTMSDIYHDAIVRIESVARVASAACDAALARDVEPRVKHVIRESGQAARMHGAEANLSDFSLFLSEAIRQDYELLLELSKGSDGAEAWTDETPVPPEVFGPMWPEGEPAGWPTNAQDPVLGETIYELTVSGPDGADPETVKSRTVQLLRLMDRYVRATGGKGVRLRDDTGVAETCPCPEPEPVGGGA